MLDLTVRNIEDDLVWALGERAMRNGTSVESEAHAILRAAVNVAKSPLSTGEQPLSEAEVERRVQRLLAFGRRPDEPFDLKQDCDELWDFVDR